MEGFSPSNLRIRLVLLVLFAVIPALALVFHTAWEERDLERRRALENAERLVRVLSSEQERFVEGARQLLVALAQLPEVRRRDSQACSSFFALLETKYPLYVNLGAIAPDGTVFCSALPAQIGMNLADRSYFQRVLEARDFTIGDYQIGQVTKKATINFAHPVLDSRGKVEAVIFAALDLAWLNQRRAAELQLPEGSALLVVDQSGTILVHYPEPERWVGKAVPDARLFKLLSARKEGTAEVSSLDGAAHFYAFTALKSESQAVNAYVVFGVAKAVAFSEVNRSLIRNLLWFGLVTALALGAAWLIGNPFIVNYITERKRLEEEAAKLKADFTAMIVHDLRSPLTAIMSGAAMLEDGFCGPVSEEQKKWLAKFQANCHAMVELVNDFLDLSKIESGHLELVKEQVDLRRLIEGSLENYSVLGRGKKISFRSRIDPRLAEVRADPRRLEQVLANLLSNAIKFNKEGGEIEVGAAHENAEQVKVWVKDSGVGIPSSEIDHLFEKYRQAAGGKASKHQGTGLGLVICKSIVEAHGGRIWVESDEGKGTTFFFSLPLSG